MKRYNVHAKVQLDECARGYSAVAEAREAADGEFVRWADLPASVRNMLPKYLENWGQPEDGPVLMRIELSCIQGDAVFLVSGREGDPKVRVTKGDTLNINIRNPIVLGQ